MKRVWRREFYGEFTFPDPQRRGVDRADDDLRRLPQANADLRASSERREAVYQAHNERMATAMAQLNAHQASQISVLKDLTASNDRLEGMVQQLRDALVGTAEQRNI
jgi:hypothetical protein